MKVLKFGGTSMANAGALERVKNIIKGDRDARFIVVSAPGKRESGDTKVTDLLLNCKENSLEFEKVEKRFLDIVKELGIKIDLSKDFLEIRRQISNGASEEYIASRGEYLSAKVFAKYIGFEFVDSSELILFSNSGKFLAEQTNKLVEKRLSKVKRAVIPGFYGVDENGKIRTFSRGGSDVTGAVIAGGVSASVYENWTDVDGFLASDPRVVENPRKIELLTYKELRELSYMGASVLHSDCIFPVRGKDIPIHIRNTFNPFCKGTLIVPTKHFEKGQYSREEKTVTGIAGKHDFLVIHIEKSMMNDEIGFARSVLSVLEEASISVEQMPSGIDTFTVVFSRGSLKEDDINGVVNEIKNRCTPDKIVIESSIALVAVVGHGMHSKKGTAATACAALSNADINIRLIDQGSSELNIIFGVEDKHLDAAIRALYAAFLG